MTAAEQTQVKAVIENLSTLLQSQSMALYAATASLQVKAKQDCDDELHGLAEIINLVAERVGGIRREQTAELQLLINSSPEDIETMELLHVAKGGALSWKR